MPKKNGQQTIAELRYQESQLKLNDDEFLANGAELLNWSLIAKKYYLQDEMLIKYSKYIKWHVLSRYQKLSEDIILKYHKKIGNFHIIKYQKPMTQNILNKIAPSFDCYNWDLLVKDIDLPYYIIEKYYTNMNLDKIPITHLSKEEQEKVASIIIIEKLSK